MISKIGKFGQLTILNMATAGTGFITFFILVRTLQIDVFGEWVLYLTAFNLVEMLKTGFVRQGFVQQYGAKEDDNERQRLIGSSLTLALLISIAITLVVLMISALYGFQGDTGIGYFFIFYPILSILGLPVAFSIWLAQAQEKQNKMAVLGLVPAAMLMLISITSLFSSISLFHVILAHSVIRVVLGIYLIFSEKHLRKAFQNINTAYLKALWNFGKYSITTLLGTNLLKSADNFLIGYFLGPGAVGIYNIPLKLLEVAEIPARSSGQLLLSSLSKLYAAHRIIDFKTRLNAAILKLQQWYLPVALLAFLAAHQLVEFIAGTPQIEAVWVLRVFLIYTILIPMDRLIGVAIDSTGHPKLNSLKVWGMVALNIIGDVLVLSLFDSLWAVAAVTVINALSGVAIGKYLMNKILKSTENTHSLKQNANVYLA